MLTTVLVCLVLLKHTTAGPADLPILGWSTWNTFGCAVNSTLLEQSMRSLASSPLFSAGYRYVLLDDCWTLCMERDQHTGKCKSPGPRDSQGRIQVDPDRFPQGFKPMTTLGHSLGLKIGIYTSVSATTCAGYTGSFQHEEVDAATFVDWGFDFIKHDTCGTDYSIHDGTLKAAVERMRNAIYSAGNGSVVYYLDSGNPTSPQRVFNPYNRHVTNQEALHKLATRPSELVWVWATEWHDGKGPHMFKSWFDRHDSWESVLSNAHNQVRLAEYQRPGQLHMPDMLTIGMGGQSQVEYEAQFYLWAVLGSPLIMGNDIRHMDNFTVALVTNREILAINQDKDCVQASLAHFIDACETWIKPLSDGSFAVVLLNKAASNSSCTVYFSGDWTSQSDFFPAQFDAAFVRDIGSQKDIGHVVGNFSQSLPSHGAVLVKVTPV